MRNRINMPQAVTMLLKSRKATSPAVARMALIAALMEEKLVACCEGYWRESIPSVRRTDDRTPWPDWVPADFWRLEHADDIMIERSYTFTGPWASWAKSNFHTEVALTGSTAALRYPDFTDLAAYGSGVVKLQFTVFDVSLSLHDVERLKTRGNFGALVRKAKEKPSIRLGNTTSSDRDDVIARLVATLLCENNPNALSLSRDEVLGMLLEVAPSAAAELRVSERSFRQFADKVVKQFSVENQIRGMFPPSS